MVRKAAPVSLLDLKLAYSMLIKHPGLTVTAGLAIAFAVALGAASVEFARDLLYPALPIDEPHELVEIHNRDIATLDVNPRALHDFETWREELRAVDEMGVFETFRQTLTETSRQDRPGRLVVATAITADGFQIARVPPLMGRGLIASDELPGAPNVIVIGYRIWKSQFAGDPNVVGRIVRFGAEPATVVGVMPEGFRFPKYHEVWTPFRFRALDFARGEGPATTVLARLSAGSSLQVAQAELDGIGQRAATEYPASNERLRPVVGRYGRPLLPMPDLMAAGVYWASILLFALLLQLVYGTVALLLFARSSAREREIVVRSALGATRARIVAQLIIETLVLAGGAAVVGLVAAQMSLGLLVSLVRDLLFDGLIGYWVGYRLSPLTAAYIVALTILGAVACGAISALKVTGQAGQSSLQRTGAAGSDRKSRRLWSIVIAMQVTATVAFLPPVIVMGLSTLEIRSTHVGFPASEYLSVQYETDRGAVPGLTLAESRAENAARYATSVSELKQRLEVEPGVTAVTMATQIPGAWHERFRIEVDGPMAPPPSSSGHRAQVVAVDRDFFAALGTPIISGRGFTPSDFESNRNVVVVNEDFARVVLGGRNPVGLRLRYVNPESPGAADEYFEIVGEVKQIAMTIAPGRPFAPGVYHPLRPAAASALHMIIRTASDPVSFIPRLRTIASEVEPTLQLLEMRPLDQAAWQTELAHFAMFWVMLIAGGLAVLLSTSGIYAIMSLSVTRRTREIGVRVSVGATRLQVTHTILSRVLWQVVFGLVAGGIISLIVLRTLLVGTYRPTMTAAHAGFFLAYLTAMAGVCLLACLVPTRRALRIEPMVALKQDV